MEKAEFCKGTNNLQLYLCKKYLQNLVGGISHFVENCLQISVERPQELQGLKRGGKKRVGCECTHTHTHTQRERERERERERVEEIIRILCLPWAPRSWCWWQHGSEWPWPAAQGRAAMCLRPVCDVTEKKKRLKWTKMKTN